MEQYLYLTGGSQASAGSEVGPVDTGTLQRLADEQKITAETKVKSVGTANWVTARSLGKLSFPAVNLTSLKVHAVVGALLIGPFFASFFWYMMVGFIVFDLKLLGIAQPDPETAWAWKLWGILVVAPIAAFVWPVVVYRSVSSTLKRLIKS